MNYNKVSDLKFNKDGGVDCVVEFDELGILPFSASSIDASEHGQKIWMEINAGEWGDIQPFVGVGLGVLKKESIQKIGEKHGQMLAQLSGNATIEERETWTLKLSAAQASINAGKPSELAVLLFDAEAKADGVSIMEKCARVVAYNQAYAMLIGIASGIKTRAENAVKAATDGEAIEAALAQAMHEAQGAAIQYLKAIGRGEI